MNICFVENFSESSPEGFMRELRDMGHKVSPQADSDTDIIFCASITKMQSAKSIRDSFKVPIVNYCWDFYKWAHEGKHDLPWGKYEEFLRGSDLVIVPSAAQQRRLKEMLNIDSVVIRTSTPVSDHATKDGGYVLDPVRYYHHDPNCYWVRDACAELDIPFVHSEHQYTKEEFARLIAEARLLTCGYVEASTGGLSLVEGLWNGKPSLVSNSPYMGAVDYLGKFGNYFQWDSYEDLKDKLKTLFHAPPVINVKEAREYISNNLSDKTMAQEIEKHLCELKNN